MENVYAPSTTPCYDTPSHNNDSQPGFESEKNCYIDVGTKTETTQIDKDKKLMNNDNKSHLLQTKINETESHASTSNCEVVTDKT